MGLGKTLQALCAVRGRTLVICPTSVMYSWADQVAKFRPALKLSIYHGPNRNLASDADIVLTSFGVARIDQSVLGATLWDTLIIDEAQTIKNSDSQIAQAIYQLEANFRVTLSGTPVENSLEDLWSQFRFLNPGLLGTQDEFEQRFAKAIRAGDSSALEALRKAIRPFILRRLKKEVAPDLPARTEMVLRTELSSQERTLYDALLATGRDEVIKLLESGGSIFSALEIILRLRQACCHQALVPGSFAQSSSKVDLLIDALSESSSEGHRSLVFSQWTSFLDLIEPHLKNRAISYSRLDGESTNRAQLVAEFQHRDGPAVMLLSLKAGGVGITLTAADHIFIMDPWWNPAVEDQAADRAHRIGQTNPVFIHRLIAKDTIEERILELQQRKLALASSILSSATPGSSTSEPQPGGETGMSLTRAELLALIGS